MSKAIVVTGGSRGIGAASARLAGQRGWSVAVNYVSAEGAAVATAEAVKSAGGKAITVQGNMAVEADVIRLFDEAARAFGDVTGVVNNAGIIKPASKFADMSLERFREIIDINVLGAFLVAREAARRLSRNRGGPGGSLVNISSMATVLGGPNEFVDYAGSKASIDALTIGLSKELGPEGVRVNAVRPGLIETDIHASGGNPDRAQQLGGSTPAGRAGSAEEVAEAIVWLLSDASSYVSGTNLHVTGGR